MKRLARHHPAQTHPAKILDALDACAEVRWRPVMDMGEDTVARFLLSVSADYGPDASSPTDAQRYLYDGATAAGAIEGDAELAETDISRIEMDRTANAITLTLTVTGKAESTFATDGTKEVLYIATARGEWLGLNPAISARWTDAPRNPPPPPLGSAAARHCAEGR